MHNLPFSYRVSFPVISPRVIGCDVKLVPSEEAILHEVAAWAEEREPGQADYPLFRPVWLKWKHEGGTVRSRLFTGLTMAEAFELLARFANAGEYEGSMFCTMRDATTEEFPSATRKLRKSADGIDRQLSRGRGL